MHLLLGHRGRLLLLLTVHHTVHREDVKGVVVGRWGARFGACHAAAGVLAVSSLPLEAQIRVGFHLLRYCGRSVIGPGGLGVLLPQPLAPANQVQGGDPQKVNNDLPKFNEAQNGAPHPEAELTTHAGEKPNNLQGGNRRPLR